MDSGSGEGLMAMQLLELKLAIEWGKKQLEIMLVDLFLNITYKLK
jgi:hypothetical protein